MNFESQLKLYQASCEEALESHARPLLQPGSAVSEAAAYGLFGGGKRVRGVLVQAICTLLEGNRSAALPLAAAIEMMHAFSLIHDDLPCMDNDEIRRGKPATHVVYGPADALLAGDLLAIQAFEVATVAQVPPVVAAKAVNALAAAAGARGMIYGQELDKRYETVNADKQALHLIHQHKTGALISVAAKLGMFCAEYTQNEWDVIDLYAINIGFVFQVVDDILDVSSSNDVLGKPVGSDDAQGKTTFASLLGVAASRNEVQQRTSEATQTVHQCFGQRAAFLVQFAEHLADRVF